MVSKMIKCPKCGGRGYIPSYAHVDGGICFQCSGSGVVDKEEYQKEIEKEAVAKERRVKRAAKKETKLIDDLKKQWFNNAESVFIVDVENTFIIKDQLKNDGAIYNAGLMVWFFTKKPENHKTFEIRLDEVFNDDVKEHGTQFSHLIWERSEEIFKRYRK